MKALLLASWMLVPSLARADSPAPAAPPSPPTETSPEGERPAGPEPAAPPDATTPAEVRGAVQRLRADARIAANGGRCDAVVDLGVRVQEIDPAYYEDTFSRDPVLANCVPAIVSAPPLRADDSLEGDVSQTTALLLSLGLTGGGLALFYAQEHWMDQRSRSATAAQIGAAVLLLVGPTAGHAYAGNWWNTGLKIRLVGLATATLGFAALQNNRCEIYGKCDGSAIVGVILFGGGLLTVTGGTISEVVTAPRSARWANRDRRVSAQLGVAPIATPHSTAPALVLAGQF